LIELLVVITILALLFLLIAHPASKAQSKAKRAQCLHNLRQIGVAMHNFVSEKGVYPPLIGGTNSDTPGTWVRLIQRGGFGTSNPSSNYFHQGVWRCPTSPAKNDDGLRSYAYNAYGAGNIRSAPLGLGSRFDPNQLFIPIRESDVSTPSDMFAIGDSAGGVILTRGPVYNWAKLDARHDGYWDLLFCDGHVAGLPLKQVFMDTSDAALARWNRDHLPHRELISR
jgi:prepilin-type processing-associated H-X9-DG protein